MNVLVLMSGGFHPFHPGHLALYNSAKQAFPSADVVVGATNVQKDRPFNFKDKATLATIAGVDNGHFVEVNRQFAVKGEPNIEGRIQNPDDTILILVRSEKDANDPVLQPWKPNPDGSVPMTKGSKNHPPRPTSNYLLSYKGNEKKLQPMTKHAYIAFLPVEEFSGNMTSATQIRNTWPTLDTQGKQKFAMSLYPATQQNSKLLKTVIDILNRNLGVVSQPVTSPLEKPVKGAIKKLKANKLKEQIQRIRPLIREASIEQKYKFLKLMKEAVQLDDGQTSDMRDFFKTQQPLGVPTIQPTTIGTTVARVTRQSEGVAEEPVDEARLHFTDPNARINVYYIPPKLHHEGKVQNIAHDIPYKLLEPFTTALMKKYKNLIPEYIVWHHVGDDPTSKYGERIEESTDYLEEK